MVQYSAEALRALLRQRKTATLDELKQALGTNVDMTVFRKLAELAYRSSYSHGGRYYTLDEIARFDELGLWSHRSARFSRYGTLLATLEALVSAAYRAARYGVAFNAMSRHVDWERDDLFHWGFDEVAAFLKRELTPNVAFRADYGLYEFTAFAWRYPKRAPQSAGAEWWKQ